MHEPDTRYLDLLAQIYPTADDMAVELARLDAALSLPKPPEFFVSDIHGEYSAFSHILKSASGRIRPLVDEALAGKVDTNECKEIATLIYYPKEKISHVRKTADDFDNWCTLMLELLCVVCRHVARGYEYAMVAEKLPENHAALLQDMLFQDCPALIGACVSRGKAPALIEDMCLLVQRLCVAQLHMVGDVYDRGPAPDAIMDMLMKYPAIDIQWGNHDIVWMGAALGQHGCIAHVVRNCARYGNLDILTDAYGINILPLATFAMETYADDPCEAFKLKVDPGLSPSELRMTEQIQKAMAILQFKTEAALIDKYPCFDLEDRKLLHKIDYERGCIEIDGIEYTMTDTYFPTVDKAHPYELTAAEEAVMLELEKAFVGSKRLQEHMRFMLERGSLYKICNGNLLLHACVPLTDEGKLLETDVYGTKCKGKALYDLMQSWVYKAFYSEDAAEREKGRDLIWYMWLGSGSPLFAKSKMATFEIYLCAEKPARKEVKNAFYQLFDSPEVYGCILEDFGLDASSGRIINGHVPVKAKDGEDPVKASGKVICIDGGMSKAYQATTGLAGYTLLDSAQALTLFAHKPFAGKDAVIEAGAELESDARVIESYASFKTVADTDSGQKMKDKRDGLEQLLQAFEEASV